MTTFNTAPYFDDFSEDSKFYKILFRPGYAVQARELTQLQSILQNQIKRQGDHIFKEGSMVIPGQMSIDLNIKHVKIQPTETDVSQFIGAEAVGSGGLTARVVYAVAAEATDPATLFVKYTNSGTSGESKTFGASESLLINGVNTVTTLATSPTGDASIASIQRGVYYVKGYFVLCEQQTIVLDKYSATPTYRLGLDVVETEITPEDDESLLDNAQGSYNYAAPGAHRYFIGLDLTKKDVTTVDDQNFIELLRVESGSIKRIVSTTQYSEIEKTLARRTFDESGNYTVRPFTIDVREHRNNDRGQWTASTSYLIGDVITSNGKTYVAKRNGVSAVNGTAPSHTSGASFDGPGNTGIQWDYNETPYYNRGIYTPAQGGSESKLAIGLEPGKAYVEGYEIEKVATEYVTINKSRESVQVDNAIIPTTVGNFVVVNNLNNLPPVNTFSTVNLYDRFVTSRGTAPGGSNIVGTARVRFIEKDNGVVGQDTTTYKVGIFDVQLNAGYNFDRDVKSMVFIRTNAQTSFTANIDPILNRIIGSVTADNSTTITGDGTSFQTDLRVGDFVSLGGFVRRVNAIVSQSSLIVDSAVTVVGGVISYITTNIQEPSNISLIYPLPYGSIKTARSALNTNDITYTVYQQFTATATAIIGGLVRLTITSTSGSFASAADDDNYLLICNDANDVTYGGVPVDPIDIQISGASATFTIANEYAGKPFSVIAAVNKSGSTLTEKTKTLILAGGPGTVVTKTTPVEATAQQISLGKADCYRLLSVKMATGSFADPGQYSIDITDRYEFDTGQRDTHYGVGSIRLKASFTPPTSPIQITFEYFNHGSGDYFTVNSYGNYTTDVSNTSNIPYTAIPLHRGVPLSDVIDFRPRMSDNGQGFLSTDVGTVLALVPKRGIDVRADYSYHLARKTKIAIDFNGNFFAIDGVSSLNPGDPPTPSMGMVLYDLTLQPYTYCTTSRDVVVKAYDNKRYTMRDIGKLEKRIDNLEYYTSLSLLEQQTESLNIIDSQGLDRFKNGFVVDSFTGHNTGNVNSPDYMCSIDMERGELRPFYSMQNINLMESATTAAERNNSSYKLYGDVITLPVLEDVPLVTQPYASRTENVNPFAIFTFLGSVVLNPSSDDWFEVDRRPDIVTEVEGNFNTVKAMAEKAGVLGTVWNAWQTQWSGTSTETRATFQGQGNGAWGRGLGVGIQLTPNELNARFGVGPEAAGWARREVTAVTTATEVGQARTGTRTSVVTKIDRQVVADRVLSTAAIPYTRSRNILVQVKGLKPNTRFFPYFDNTPVESFCTPATRLVYIPISGTFDDSTNVGGLTSDIERRIDGDTQVCLNRGDMIRGSTTNATAIVVGKEFDADTNTYALYVVNVKGSFSPADTIRGNVSSASGTFISIDAPQQAGSTLTTNFSGDLQLLFNIPNTEAIRFRTGIREFKLADSSTPDGDFTSRGRGNYRAQGVLETRQATVNAVRNGEIVEEQVAENRVIVQTSDRVVADTGWYDPLAQTFLVESPGGAFLSKIDIFFASKDTKIPVNIEIREVVNGYPGKIVLPFSKVSLKPEQVSLSNTTVDLDGVAVPKYDTPTSFVFPSPVYVQDRQEYAIVISSDSNNYKVWISQLGDQIPGSTRTISEQPYMGVFFKSQNASTWTADQMQDLKFTIYRAQFDTSVVSNVEFVNSTLPLQTLEADPFETRLGVNKIRVYQRNHGMPAGSRVTLTDRDAAKIEGVAGTGTITSQSTSITGISTNFVEQLVPGSVLYTSTGLYVGVIASIQSSTSLTLVSPAQTAIVSGSFKYQQPIAGIPATEIYATHIVTDVEFDSYCITVPTPAKSTGYAGGITVRATRNIQYDAFQPMVQVQSFPDTEVSVAVKTTSGMSPDSTSQQPYNISPTYADALVNETNYFFAPRMVASEVNEDQSLSGAKSLTMKVAMSTTNPALSPIIDTQRTSFVAINNKVNNPSADNTNVGGLDSSVLVSNTSLVSVVGNQVQTADTDIKDLLKNAVVGKYITVQGAASGNSTLLVTRVETDGSAITFDGVPTAVSGNVTLTQHEFFVDEIAPEGSSTFSKYLTNQISLANTSTFIRTRFAASIPPESMVDVYYRTAVVGSTTALADVNWTYVPPDQPITFSQPGSNSFVDMSFSTPNIPAFGAMQVKLVMRSSNTSATPIIKDLRVIACA